MTAEKSPPSVDRTRALLESLVAMFGLGGPEPANLRAIVEKFAPEDIAHVLGDLDETQKIVVFKSIASNEDQGVVLEETDRQSHREILEALTEAERQEIIGEMPVDDMVDHLEELPEAEQRRLIATLDQEEAEDVEELLQYEPDTAGGMMTTEFITIPVGTDSGDALAKIQGNLGAEIIQYVYVTEDGEFLRGVVSIREILRNTPQTSVDSYMETDVVKVLVDTDREEVSAAVEKYNLQAVPVVDNFDRIRGIVTFDDVMEAVQEEHSEDMLRMAGTTAVHPLYEPIWADVAKRLPFLMVTMLGGLSVAMLLKLFKTAVGVPIFAWMIVWVHLVSALSGNVAVVTSTVMVRGLATGEIKSRLSRAVFRELLVGATIAVTLAVVVSIVFYVYHSSFEGNGEHDLYGLEAALLALAAAMVVSLAWAGFIGALVPVVCRLTGFVDPAIASGPFVTITCDISASVIFFLFIRFFLDTGSS